MTEKMISVPKEALSEVLRALNGPGHLIRELQMTRGWVDPNNPIDLLIKAYEESSD